jgi:hypothetical protein
MKQYAFSIETKQETHHMIMEIYKKKYKFSRDSKKNGIWEDLVLYESKLSHPNYDSLIEFYSSTIKFASIESCIISIFNREYAKARQTATNLKHTNA